MSNIIKFEAQIEDAYKISDTLTDSGIDTRTHGNGLDTCIKVLDNNKIGKFVSGALITESEVIVAGVSTDIVLEYSPDRSLIYAMYEGGFKVLNAITLATNSTILISPTSSGKPLKLIATNSNLTFTTDGGKINVCGLDGTGRISAGWTGSFDFIDIKAIGTSSGSDTSDVSYNMLYHYKFDDNDGSANVVDSVSDNTATAQRNTNLISSTGNTGLENTSLEFNGNSDYIQATTKQWFGQDFSFSGFFYVRDQTTNPLFYTGDAGSNGFGVYYDNKVISVIIGGINYFINYNYDMISKWTHVTLTKTAGNIFRLYINSIFVGSFTNTFFLNDLILYIGSGGGVSKLNGFACKCRVSNLVINSTQVLETYNIDNTNLLYIKKTDNNLNTIETIGTTLATDLESLEWFSISNYSYAIVQSVTEDKCEILRYDNVAKTYSTLLLDIAYNSASKFELQKTTLTTLTSTDTYYAYIFLKTGGFYRVNLNQFTEGLQANRTSFVDNVAEGDYVTGTAETFTTGEGFASDVFGDKHKERNK